MDRLSAAEADLRQHTRDIDKDVGDAIQAINNRYDEIIRAALVAKTAAMDAVTALKDTAMREYSDKMQVILARRHECEQSLSRTKDTITSGCSLLLYETYRELEESMRKVLSAQDPLCSSAKKAVMLTGESRKAFDDIQGMLLRAFDTSLQVDVVIGRMVIDRGAGMIGTGSEGNAIGQFNYPIGTALSPPSRTYPGGLLFVADALNHRVQVFNATTSAHIRTIGTGVQGNGNDQFVLP